MNFILRTSLSPLVGVTFGALALTGCATASPTGASNDGPTEEASQALDESACPPGVPAALTPAADQNLTSILDATGVQVYVCIENAAGFSWSFVSPNANLYNDDGKLVGTHLIGPTWQGNDGSSVVGTKIAAATVDPTAIPWLLLTAASHAPDAGRFSDVTTVQRLETVGGIAPLTGCDATAIGKIAEVPYTARYAFYKTKDQGKVHQCSGN